ncbi:MAG: haloalkane dehalogenase, partial [Anderseniella sp.]
MRTMIKSSLTVAACLTLLSFYTSLSTAQAQNPAPTEPSLTMPLSESPPEPGDAARAYRAMVPRSDLRYKKKTMQVLGTKIAYVDEGKGDAIVFIHGAPESIYVWRNIMPYVEPYGRIVAFDLPGHGDSGKPDIKYTFSDYRKYVEAIMAQLDLGDNIVLVIHDWGTVLGLDWARKNEKRMKGVAMMEALIAPFYPIGNVAEASKRRGKAGAIEHYKLYQQEIDKARALAIDQNLFIEQTMQIHTYRELSQREMAAYRNPFRRLKDREPLVMWAREVGLDGNRPITDKAMKDYNAWMLQTDVRFLDIYGFPGEVSEEYDVRWRVERMKNIETAFVGIVLHFVQEDQPVATG